MPVWLQPCFPGSGGVTVTQDVCGLPGRRGRCGPCGPGKTEPWAQAAPEGPPWSLSGHCPARRGFHLDMLRMPARQVEGACPGGLLGPRSPGLPSAMGPPGEPRRDVRGGLSLQSWVGALGGWGTLRRPGGSLRGVTLPQTQHPGLGLRRGLTLLCDLGRGSRPSQPRRAKGGSVLSIACVLGTLGLLSPWLCFLWDQGSVARGLSCRLAAFPPLTCSPGRG